MMAWFCHNRIETSKSVIILLVTFEEDLELVFKSANKIFTFRIDIVLNSLNMWNARDRHLYESSLWQVSEGLVTRKDLERLLSEATPSLDIRIFGHTGLVLQ